MVTTMLSDSAHFKSHLKKTPTHTGLGVGGDSAHFKSHLKKTPTHTGLGVVSDSSDSVFTLRDFYAQARNARMCSYKNARTRVKTLGLGIESPESPNLLNSTPVRSFPGDSENRKSHSC